MEMWIIVVCTLIDDEYASLLFPQTFFFSLFLPVERLCKSFRKESLMRTSSLLDNAARAPSYYFEQNVHWNLNGFLVSFSTVSHLTFEECQSELCGVFKIPRNGIFFH